MTPNLAQIFKFRFSNNFIYLLLIYIQNQKSLFSILYHLLSKMLLLLINLISKLPLSIFALLAFL